MHFSLCDFVIDCLQNSVEAEAGEITLDFEQDENMLTVKIGDDGKGMTSAELEKVKDPFYTDGIKHEKRKVGLGIPFLLQTINMTEGGFDIQSEKGKGTSLMFSFNLDHIDCPPMGDVPSTFMQAMSFDGDYNLVINRSISLNGEKSEYSISRSELKDALGDLDDSDSLILLRKYLRSQEEDLLESFSD